MSHPVDGRRNDECLSFQVIIATMGYDEKRFKQEVDSEFFCSICLDVLRDPVQVPCGHVYCSQCICEWSANHNNTCPNDGSSITSMGVVGYNFKNLLNRMNICCEFEGCDWTGPLSSLDGHVSLCQFNLEAEKTCSTCDSTFTRKDEADHDCIKSLKTRVEDLTAGLTRARTAEQIAKERLKEINRLRALDHWPSVIPASRLRDRSTIHPPLLYDAASQGN